MKREITIEIKDDLNHYALIKQKNNRENETNYGMLIDKDQYEQLRQHFVSGSLRPLTVQRVDKMLKDISLQTFIACGGNKTEWKEWWSKRNDVNVNSNNC